MNELEQIEQKYDFLLPEAYSSMQARGWFDVKSDDYFWLLEAEWMPLTEMQSYEPEEYQKPGFVPFASEADGSHWCWWPSAYPESVVLCPRDCYDGEFYAPSFEGFLYRRLLDFCGTGFDMENGAEEAEENRDILKTSVARLSDYLPNAWQKTLESLTTASPVQRVYNGRPAGVGLLTYEQQQATVQRDLAFPLLDQEFQWMYP